MKNEVAIEHLTGVGSSARERDEAMAALAQVQHGVVRRGQLLELGFSRRSITGALERGRLHEVFLGVYVVGVRRISRRGRWMATVLAAGGGGVLSHRSAARLWRLLPPAVEWIDVTCRPGRVIRRKGIVAHESVVAENERMVVDRIPVTSPFRTVFDLASVLDKRGLERAWHEAEVRGLRDRVSLPMLLERYPGRRGTRNLRALLEEPEPVGLTRNDFEEAFVALVDSHDLRRPRMNADLHMRGHFFQVDALWQDERVAVELDSRSVHASNKNFEGDKQRDRILLAEGYRTIRVTWRQLHEEPHEVVADLRKALGSGCGLP